MKDEEEIQIVEKAAMVDVAIRDLRSAVRDDGAEWMFQDIEQMLTIIMRDCAGRWGSVWDFDPNSVVPLGAAA